MTRSQTPDSSSSVPPSAKPSLYPALSKREIGLGQALLVVFLLLVSLPYLWCALITSPGFTWGGLFFSADDQNVHLMWAKQTQLAPLFSRDFFFIRDLFTTEGLVKGDRQLFFNLFTFCLGLAARISHIDTIFWYHIARVAFAGLFVHQLHKLLVAATGGAPERENARLGALALATLATGGGFVLAFAPFLVGKVLFLDHPTNSTFVTVPEAFALLSALIYPLNMAGFVLLSFLLRALIENRGTRKENIKVFFAALVLANIHTYDSLPILVMCLVALGWSILKRETIKAKLPLLGAIFTGSVIPIVYQAIVFRGSEEFRVKALTATSPPAIQHLLSTFFPLLVLGALGLWSWRRRWTAGTGKWLGVYAVSLLILMYLPKSPSVLGAALFSPHGGNVPFYLISFSRKMIEGLQIPLLVFAGAGLAALPRRKYSVPLVVGICALSPIIFYAWTIDNATTNNQRRVQAFLMPPYYLSNADNGALQTLQQVADKKQAVLCLPLIGSYLPRATGLYTYTGHWAETLYLNRKLGEELRFYRGQMASAEARTFLKDNHIGYIIESPYERGLASNPSVAASLGFTSIYSGSSPDGPTVVYQVQ